MKAFFLAVVAAFCIAGLASLLLESFQRGSDVANTTGTGGVRLDFGKDGSK